MYVVVWYVWSEEELTDSTSGIWGKANRKVYESALVSRIAITMIATAFRMVRVNYLMPLYTTNNV